MADGGGAYNRRTSRPRARVPANLELSEKRRLVQFYGLLLVSMAALELELEQSRPWLEPGCLN